MNGSFVPSAQSLGARFNLVAAVPATILVAFVGAIMATGAPWQSPSFSRAGHTIDALSIQDIAVLLLVTLVVALVLHPFQVSFVKLLEGYGPTRGPFAALRRLGVRRYEALYDFYYASLVPPSRHEAENRKHAARIEARNKWADERLAQLPRRSRLLPTRLGNALRCAEDLAGRRYGLDAIQVIPRLFPLMGQDMAAIINDARNQLDVMASFVFVWMVATCVAVLTLFAYGAWVAVALVPFLLACAAYRACVTAARSYGDTLAWAIDLYRFALYDQLRVDQPKSHAEELANPNRLTDFLKGDWARGDQLGTTWHPTYTHPESGSADACL